MMEIPVFSENRNVQETHPSRAFVSAAVAPYDGSCARLSFPKTVYCRFRAPVRPVHCLIDEDVRLFHNLWGNRPVRAVSGTNSPDPDDVFLLEMPRVCIIAIRKLGINFRISDRRSLWAYSF